jgi:hypothetical protein
MHALDKSGKMTPTRGVVLPDEYTGNHSSAQPWNCPIDECSRPFRSLRALGDHFPVSISAEVNRTAY